VANQRVISLRKVPEKLYNQVKVAAFTSGQTLREWVIEVLGRAVGSPVETPNEETNRRMKKLRGGK
jgi:hypothetical protein